jgi:hypothetical protein
MRYLVFLVILAAQCVIAQDLSQRTFLVRAETTTVDPYSGMMHVCVLVYPDGKYRLEKSFQSNQGAGGSDVRVYMDTLPDASLKQLQSALDDEGLQQITTPDPRGGIIQDMDVLGIAVPREHKLQNLNFETAKERKPYEKSLKPFLNWMKDVQKRKTPVAKQEKSDNCRAPQVLYRTMFRRQPTQENSSSEDQKAEQ